MYSTQYQYHGDVITGTASPVRPRGRDVRRHYEAPSAPSYFLDPWQYGLRFLKPCLDGPPTVAQSSQGRAAAGGRGSSVESDTSTGSANTVRMSPGSGSGTARAAASPSMSPASSSLYGSLPPELVAAVKDRRKLLKKLRQIAGLKQRMADGARLDSQQLAKLETEPRLRAALEDRERSLVAAGVALSPGGTVDPHGPGRAMPSLAI
mmetsp:Transcript_1689/g.2524  ORF Transcript_1689/g.2524 Transcript_1689/m.2524 type:complete len:207 (+) Transcript_1689:2-622(+)